jgi:asparagine synthase (glutamine-hydrolysing)
MGLNSLENGFNISYEKSIVEKFGKDFVYLTGDGGDRIKPHIKLSYKVKDINQLTHLVLEKNALPNSDIVLELLNVPKAEIINELMKYLEACPEKDWLHKYIHFMVYESAFKYVFEGEDRKRHFFWATTPFYSLGFFMKVMAIADNHKKDYKLYKDFLVFLNKDLAMINNADWGFPINSFRRGILLKLKSTFNLKPTNLKSEFIKCINFGKKTNNPNLVKLINDLSKINLEKPCIFSSLNLVFKCLDHVSDAKLLRIITPVLLYLNLHGNNMFKREYEDVPFI